MKKREKKTPINKGLSFGLTSGVITTLGLIVGLNSATNSSRLAIIGGIIIIAIADSLSDAFGIHISEESQLGKSKKDIWSSTFSTAFYKFIFAITFIIPILLLAINQAIIASIIWGLLLISILSYKIAKTRNMKPYKIITEHVIITIIVVALSAYIGNLVPRLFG